MIPIFVLIAIVVVLASVFTAGFLLGTSVLIAVAFGLVIVGLVMMFQSGPHPQAFVLVLVGAGILVLDNAVDALTIGETLNLAGRAAASLWGGG